MDKTRKPYPLKARDRIRATQLIERLQRCALGEIDMTQNQIAAARILLAKALPDLSSTQIEDLTRSKPPRAMTDAELRTEIESRLAAIRDATGGAKKEACA